MLRWRCPDSSPLPCSRAAPGETSKGERQMSDDTRGQDHNLALDLLRVTEAGALAAGRVAGRGDADLADRVAVDAVRRSLDVLPIDGLVVVGEGEERRKERLYLGERLGAATEPRMDVAADPIDGTDLVA